MSTGTARIARRPSKRPAKPFAERATVRAIEALFCLALMGWVGFELSKYLKESSRFAVKHLRIEGLVALDEDTVVEKSELTMGDNLLFFNAEQTQKRVEALPYVKSCAVSRAFPDTVILNIEERIPIGTLLLNSHAYEIDADRVVLREYAPNDMPLAPFFSNVKGLEFVEIGDQVAQPALATAIEVWNAFAATDMSHDVTVAEISAEDLSRIRMFCDQLPFELTWGRGHFAEQAARLDILWRQKDKNLACLEYLDLRFGKELVCK